MRKNAGFLIILIIALGLFNSNASAQAGKAKGKAKPQANQGVEKGKARRAAKPSDRERGWERRDGFDLRTYTGQGRPPGWNRGKKTGWENCGVPPGQAKKGACRTYTYSGHRYFYYENEGRIIVRRIAVHVGVR